MKFDKEINDKAVGHIIATTMRDTDRLPKHQLTDLLKALNLSTKQKGILYRELRQLNLPNAQTGS